MNDFSSHPLYRRHTIDSAMSSLWEFYKTRFLTLFLISFVMSLIMQYSSTLIDLREMQSITDPQEMLMKMREYLLPMLAISLVTLLFTTIIHYFVLYNPLDQGNNILVCIINSLRYYIPYLIVIILLAFAGSIAIILGILALVIGVFFAALYIFMIYLFILPVMMVEGPNIGHTITRSITLSHRNFWSNMGWSAVFLIILIVISIILSGIVLLPFTGSFMKVIVTEDVGSAIDFTSRPSFIFLSAVVNALTLPLLPIFASIIYFNGKAGEEVQVPGSDFSEPGRSVRVEDLYARPWADDNREKPDND